MEGVAIMCMCRSFKQLRDWLVMRVLWQIESHLRLDECGSFDLESTIASLADVFGSPTRADAYE